MNSVPWALALVGWSAGMLLAQATSTDPTVDVIGLVVQLGLSGVFFWQWRDEKAQRIRYADQLLTLTRELAPLLIDAVSVLKAYDASVSATVRQASALPDRSDIDIATRRMEMAVDALNKLAQREGE